MKEEGMKEEVMKDEVIGENHERLQKQKIEETAAYFGPLYAYVRDDAITDIDYNGRELWLTDSGNIRYECKECILTEEFVEQFTKRVANTVSKPFHKQHPVLEAETDTLRITIVHESVAITGRSICIRKSLPYIRMTEEKMIQEGYCQKEVLQLLKNCIRARMNMVFCGEPGVGKTECAKFFSQFISKEEKVITIEETPEWHYRQINPGKDCIELRINKALDYTMAIKTCLRLNPKWMILSEVRSKEVAYLMESFSTGIRGITTLHTDDVRKIPDRMMNMAGQILSGSRMENDIYSFIDVGILLKRKEVRQKDGRYSICRYIDQICFFTREANQNTCRELVEEGKLTNVELPKEVLQKMQEAGIFDPFQEPDSHQKQPFTGNFNVEGTMDNWIAAEEICFGSNEKVTVHEEKIKAFLVKAEQNISEEIQSRGTYRGKTNSL